MFLSLFKDPYIDAHVILGMDTLIVPTVICRMMFINFYHESEIDKVSLWNNVLMF